MEKILPIAYLGHDILRKETSKIIDFNDKDLQNFIDDMIATVKDANGLGIAAPQVYNSKRIFIMASKPSVRYPNAPEMEAIAIINPVIINHSEEKIKDWEGCLSIPGIRGLVPRSKSINVEFTTRHNKKVNKHFDGFIARIFQHEYDHLHGIVFLDRLDSTKDIISEKEYQKIVRK